MKYVAIWFGVASSLGLLALVLTGGYLLVLAASSDPRLLWIPAIVVAILLIATLATVIEYLTERPKAVEEAEPLEQ